MKIRFLVFFSIFGFIFGSCVIRKTVREDIEWTSFRWNHESDTSKPRVLFIGNSISDGYFNKVSSHLDNFVNCDHLATSRCIEDPSFFKETKIAMAKYKHAVIHFNNGLHGWHLTNEEYQKGLERYVKFLKLKKSKDCFLIYSLTTPVSSKEQGQKLDPVRNQIVLSRNRIAHEIMEKNNIPVIDLYSLIEAELDKYIISKGNVHYKEEGYDMMAKMISNEILRLIE